jgi:hypothetical protein
VGEPRKSYRGEFSFPLIPAERAPYFMWVAIVFIAPSELGRLEGDVVRDPATGSEVFGIGVWHDHSRGQSSCCWPVTLGLSRAAARCGRADSMKSRRSPWRDYAYACVSSLNGASLIVRVVQPHLGGVIGPVRPSCVRWASSPT